MSTSLFYKTIKYRKDITDYLISELGEYYKKKDYKFYEQDGFLYNANYDHENPCRKLNFTSYSLLWFDDGLKLKPKIEKKFNVKFIEELDIVCRCGETKQFIARYGDYSLILQCNRCKNEFTGYSG